MKYTYSVSTLGFYPASKEEQEPFIEANSLPKDLKPITDEDYFNFFNPPKGYGAVFDENGPRVEKLTEPNYSEVASQRKDMLAAEANLATYQASLKIGLGRKLTDDEAVKTNEWMDYMDSLNGLDLSSVKTLEDYEEINWPEKPE